MISIKYNITEKFNDYDVKSNDLWFGIYGGFEMHINDKQFGYCPHNDEFLPEALTEDILYMLAELANCMIVLSKKGEYILQLLPHTEGKLSFKLKDNVIIEYHNQNSIMEWNEKCDWKQFIDELCRNLERFICIVRKENKKLFELKEYAQIVSALEYIKKICV